MLRQVETHTSGGATLGPEPSGDAPVVAPSDAALQAQLKARFTHVRNSLQKDIAIVGSTRAAEALTGLYAGVLSLTAASNIYTYVAQASAEPAYLTAAALAAGAAAACVGVTVLARHFARKACDNATSLVHSSADFVQKIGRDARNIVGGSLIVVVGGALIIDPNAALPAAAAVCAVTGALTALLGWRAGSHAENVAREHVYGASARAAG